MGQCVSRGTPGARTMDHQVRRPPAYPFDDPGRAEMMMKRFAEGLRCQDVHAGLRNVDPASGVLRPLMDTRLVGMAATLASLIRGQDVVADASAVQAVAA